MTVGPRRDTSQPLPPRIGADSVSRAELDKQEGAPNPDRPHAQDTQRWNTTDRRLQHQSSPAKSGPPRDPRRAPAGPPPPRWRAWLLVIGIGVSALLLIHPASKTPSPVKLTLTQFVNDVN